MKPENLTNALKKMTSQETDGLDAKPKIEDDDEVPGMPFNFFFLTFQFNIVQYS